MASAESRITFLDGTKEEAELDCHLCILEEERYLLVLSHFSQISTWIAGMFSTTVIGKVQLESILHLNTSYHCGKGLENKIFGSSAVLYLRICITNT